MKELGDDVMSVDLGLFSDNGDRNRALKNNNMEMFPTPFSNFTYLAAMLNMQIIGTKQSINPVIFK